MTIDDYLSRNGISAATFAADLDISEASLSRIRGGTQNISRDLIQKIVEKSGGKVSLDSLVFPKPRKAA